MRRDLQRVELICYFGKQEQGSSRRLPPKNGGLRPGPERQDRQLEAVKPIYSMRKTGNELMVSHRFDVQKRLSLYRSISLKVDLSKLSNNERQIIPYLRNAASQMDLPYWIQEYGEPSEFLNSIDDPVTRRYCEINYGPWDRMFGNEAFLEGVGKKPRGANYYPSDITKEELEIASTENPELMSPFSMIRRTSDQQLVSIPYHEFFHESVENSAEWLQRAAASVESPHLKRFLKLRSEGLLIDKYGPSDVAWLELSDSNLDILIGPTEIEDRLFGIKTAYTGTLFLWKRKCHGPSYQTSFPFSGFAI